MSLLSKYIKDVEQDLVLNDFNIKETQLKLPAKKHFWVARLIEAKRELQELSDKEKKIIKILATKIKEQSPVTLSDKTVLNLIEEQEEFAAIKEKKRDLTNVVEYLEKVEKIFGSMHWEVRNVIELQKLETL
jgi:predicted phage-related endonuclease